MSETFVRWAESLQREVYDYWRRDHDDWAPGFQVYYDPVDPTADVLVLGYQPGGGPSSFAGDLARFERGDFSLPERHHYLSSDYRLANEMRRLLGEEVIRNSVKTNINFFRAPDVGHWVGNLPERRRREMGEFCFRRVEELVDRLDPALVITEGTASTLDPLEERFGLETAYDLYRDGDSGHRLVSVTEGGPWKAVGLMHPSGSRISEGDRARMRTAVRGIVDEETDLDVPGT